jgi:hypothetical protein
MDERIERIGFNEDLFRKVNERVRSLGHQPQAAAILTIVCECGDDSCVEQIHIGASEYEHVRTAATQFAVVPGHELPDVESVIRRTSRYFVVRKRDGDAARFAEELAARP